jgi:hypothetical protein
VGDKMSVITSARDEYESLMGLGDASPGLDWTTYDPTSMFDSVGNAVSTGYTDLTSYLRSSAPIPVSAAAPGNPGQGFNWASLIAPIEATGLQIARNVTNPAYNTPGSFTRLADGTVIATAGTQATGYTSVNPPSFNSLLSPGSSIGGVWPLLLVGGIVLLFMVGKK